MNREAIESFVDEIRDDMPKLRRAFAIMHACLDDRDATVEAHRLTHSLKGTAGLVGVSTLSQIAGLQEQLLDKLVDGRLTMDDELRDTLERLADIAESYADGLLAGTVPEDRLLAEAVELCRRHDPTVGHVFNVPARNEHVENVLHEPMVVSGHTELSALDVFRIEANGQLRVLVEQLDTYRSDLTRWDVLADVHRRFGLLQQSASSVGMTDFAQLTEHSASLLQRVLDRNVPPNEQIADCLQGCVDALEERLERPLDESILQMLHERIEHLCEIEPPAASPAVENSQADEELIPETNDVEPVPCEPVMHSPTSPESVELDDRSQLNEEMLEVFHEEAEDHLRLIYSAFAELEKNPARMSAIQDVRRSAHTIKGAAGSVGLRLVSKLSHRMEDLLERLFAAQQPVCTSTLALLFDTADALQDLVHGDYAAEGMQFTVAQLYDCYDSLLSGADSGREPRAESRQPLSQPPAEVEEMSETVVDTASVVDDISRNALASGSCEEVTAEPEASVLPLIEASEEPGTSAPELMETSEEPAAPVTVESVVTDSGQAPQNSELAEQSVISSQSSIPPILNSAVPDPEHIDSEQIAAPVAAEPSTPSELVVNDFLPMLAAWNRLSEPVSIPPPQLAESLAESHEQKRQGESLRVPLARLDSLMREVGELIINRSAFEQRMLDFARCVEEMQRAVARMKGVAHDLDAKYGVGALGGRRALWGDGASLMPGGRRFGNSAGDEFDALELDRYSEFHLLSRSLAESTTDLGTVGNELRNLMGDFDQLLNRQGRLSRDTQDRLMRIRMVPLTTLAAKLQRTVRVVAGQQHKDVELLIQGADTELDKLVLEELADPLMHILRNAVDHGLEAADVRRAANKPERATIRVQAFSQGTQVILRISDDGAGLNFDAIRETAVRHGLVAASDVANLNEEELAAFIFLPGFSTARTVSEVSGRGVGMDIVGDKVQKLKGTISVESHAGQGTTFTIRLPMTLAVTRALLVRASHETFALPMQSVVQILRLERQQIDKLGPSPVIRLGEETLPLVYLSEQLRLRHPADKTSATLPVLVLAAGDQKVAVAVEKILSGRDIVVKTLGSHLRKVKGLIGATLMGDGSVVPILDAADLVGHAGTATRPRSVVPVPHRLIHRDETPLLMVVDDSVSVRRVMTNLLKNSGWQVLEAKDGIDALEKLQQAERQPDLFLLDIEMPRMDGYELLTSLRSQTEHRQTPIVMVTSRAGDKHRQKAKRLGATDYVIKPYQDDELLSLLRSLLAAQRELTLT